MSPEARDLLKIPTIDTDQELAANISRMAADLSDLIRLARSRGLVVEILEDEMTVNASGATVEAVQIRLYRPVT